MRIVMAASPPSFNLTPSLGGRGSVKGSVHVPVPFSCIMYRNILYSDLNTQEVFDAASG